MRRLKARLGIKAGSVRACVLSATLDRDLNAIAHFAYNLTGERIQTSSIFFGECAPVRQIEKLVHRSAESYASFTPEAIARVLENPESLGDLSEI